MLAFIGRARRVEVGGGGGGGGWGLAGHMFLQLTRPPILT